MKLGFIYAGQGSQKVAMGEDLWEAFPAYRQAFEAMDPTGRLRALCGGDLETLSQTQNTQPCMVAFGLALTALLGEKGLEPAYALGLSLGEYSALACAGVFSPSQAVELVAFRGEVMAQGVAGRDCKMAAVLGLEAEKLQQACDQAAALGVVEIANYNCPGQLVLGGDSPAVDKAGEIAKELGARRILPLKVSGPFHTSLMSSAGQALQEKFRDLSFGAPHIPVVFNATARPLQPGETIPDLLVRQVQSSVYFQDSIRYLLQEGVDTLVEIGPGKVLSGFVKKIQPEIPCYAVEDVASLELTLQALNGQKA